MREAELQVSASSETDSCLAPDAEVAHEVLRALDDVYNVDASGDVEMELEDAQTQRAQAAAA